jgi:hypothetical protein
MTITSSENLQGTAPFSAARPSIVSELICCGWPRALQRQRSGAAFLTLDRVDATIATMRDEDTA